MYSIYIKAPREDSGSVLIYDDLNTDPEYLLIEPRLIKEDNAAGSLEFEVPLKNVGYPYITPFDSDMDVYVYKQGYKNIDGAEYTDDVYWSGRVVDVSRGIDNHKIVYCEGVLAFLNDSIQFPGLYTTVTQNNDAQQSLHSYIGELLFKHNMQVPDNRKIYLGETTAEYEPTTWYTNYETTMDVLTDIASATSGHMRIRRSVRNGHSAWVFDLLNDDVYDPSNPEIDPDDKWRYYWHLNEDQQIEYGVNLTDLNIAQSLSNIVTAVIPLGKRKDTSSIEGIDEYININDTTLSDNDLPDGISFSTYTIDGKVYKFLKSSLADPDNIGNRPGVGKIMQVVNYDDVENPDELVLLGLLNLTTSDNISYEVSASAIDGSYRDHNLQPIEAMDVLQVYASPHGLLSYMKVSKIEIPLDSPSEATYTIGTSKIGTLTDLTNRQNKSINSELKYLSVKPFVEPPAPNTQTRESEE